MISIHKSNISNDDISILTSTDTSIDILSPLSLSSSSSSLLSIDNKEESYQLNELIYNKSYNDNNINESLYKKDINTCNRTTIYDQRLVILMY